jgi:hypothetical protein
MGLVRLMQTPAGRVARIVAGAGLIAAGAWVGGGWLALVAVGLVPLVAGLAGVCFVAPLLHVPLRSLGRP